MKTIIFGDSFLGYRAKTRLVDAYETAIENGDQKKILEVASQIKTTGRVFVVDFVATGDQDVLRQLLPPV